VRWGVLRVITCALLASSVSAQQVQKSADRTKSGRLTQVTIGGKRIMGSDVLVWKGTSYVSVAALAQALDASVTSEGNLEVLTIPENECGPTPDERMLSDEYRSAAGHIPDAIEKLRDDIDKQRALGNHDMIPGTRFDDIDRDIADAEQSAQTGADKSISYALSHANSALAISYYRSLRGAEYSTQAQLDLEVCELESKVALKTGRLSGREICSVFHFNQEEVKVSSSSAN